MTTTTKNAPIFDEVGLTTHVPVTPDLVKAAEDLKELYEWSFKQLDSYLGYRGHSSWGLLSRARHTTTVRVKLRLDRFRAATDEEIDLLYALSDKYSPRYAGFVAEFAAVSDLPLREAYGILSKVPTGVVTFLKVQ